MARSADLAPYCYQCRTNVRGTMTDHLATRRHRDATRPRSTRAGSHCYSGRRAAHARAYATLRRGPEAEYADVTDAMQEAASAALGLSPALASALRRHGWAWSPEAERIATAEAAS